MDLRAMHPLIRIVYANDVVVEYAQKAHGIPQSGRYFSDVLVEMRRQIVASLIERFGAASVDASGNKAIRLKKLHGSRSDVDIVPMFKYLWVWWNDPADRIGKIQASLYLEATAHRFIIFRMRRPPMASLKGHGQRIDSNVTCEYLSGYGIRWPGKGDWRPAECRHS